MAYFLIRHFGSKWYTLPMAQLLLERYELLEKIGAGAFSQVYKAVDKKIERYVAIKVIPVNKRTAVSALREAKSVALLNHPNIVTLYEFEQTPDNYYLIMELIEGQTLAQLLSEQQPLPQEVTLAIMVQICQAIAYAHKQGVIHRDLKPSNLMVLPDGRIKVMDFGIARLRTASGQAEIKEKELAGTFSYLSPEQARGEEASEASDVFALGVLSYQLLTGQLPFAGATPAQILAQILNHEPPAPTTLVPDISPELSCLILDCLQKDNRLRIQSADELGQKLSDLLNSEDPTNIVKSFLELESSFQDKVASSLRQRLSNFYAKHYDLLMRLLSGGITSLSTLNLARMSVGNEVAALLLLLIFGLFLVVPPVGLGLALAVIVYALAKFAPVFGVIAGFLAISYFAVIARPFPLLAALPLAAPLLANWQIAFVYPLAVGLSFGPALAGLFSFFGFLLVFASRLLSLASVNWLSLKPLPKSAYAATSSELLVTISNYVKAHPEVVWQAVIWLATASLMSLIKGKKRQLSRMLAAVFAGTGLIGVATLYLNNNSQIKTPQFLQTLTFSLIIVLVILLITKTGQKE